MNRSRLRSIGRTGWLVITLVLAGALVGSSWVNYREARSAVTTLNQGQMTLLEAAFRDNFPPWQPLPDSAALAAFAEQYPEYGIRYISLLDTNDDPITEFGSPLGERPLGPADRDEDGPPGPPVVDLGERIRTWFARPIPRSEREPNAGRRERFALTVVEFEPVVASELVARAESSLVIAGFGATVLALAALLFWQMSERYNQATIRLAEQKRLSQLGEMSAVLAHEIRNPLASLKGNAQLLAERLDPDSRERGRAERVVSEATRLEALTSDLLNFSRVGPLDRQPADPAALLAAAASEVGENAVELDVAGAPESWPLDAPRIRQALVNLLRNAQQMSNVEAPPIARVTRQNGTLIYEIRDFGPGIKPGDEERIFDPFYTTMTNGTGLGLPVARRVVEMHGGRLTAENQPDRGAVFRLTLPERAE